MKQTLAFGNVWRYNKTNFEAFVIGLYDDEVLYYHLNDANHKRKKITAIVKNSMPVKEFFQNFYLYNDTKWYNHAPTMNHIVNKQLEEWDIWNVIQGAKKI